MVYGTFSLPKVTTTGVPHGSTFGPLLFFRYANDLPDCLDHTTQGMYADDVRITATAETVDGFEKIVRIQKI